MAVPILVKIGAGIRKAFGLSPLVDQRGSWWPIVREPFTGAWQRNQEWTVDSVAAYHAVYRCITLIANDIGKLQARIVEADSDGIWQEREVAAFTPVLRRPNRYQNHIQFKQWWITCKLFRGNTYALKGRDNRGVVNALYILDPNRVTVLVSPDGSIFYRLSGDNLSGIEEGTLEVPASEIIHDRMNCLFHPLIGVSPLFAAGLAADEGLRMQQDSQTFFGNAAQPGGVLTAPGAISDETAARLKAYFADNFTGTNAGNVAIAGDGLKFEAMRISSVDSQLIEQLRWTAEVVCGCFGVPAYKAGVGPWPANANVEAADQAYYSQCLQILIEEFELSMDDGLGLDWQRDKRGVELDLDGLLRMDSATQVDTLSKAVGGGITTPNEARKRLNAKPLKGGDTVYLQQQQYSIEALAERDADKPFSKPTPAPAPQPTPAANEDDEIDVDEEAIRSFEESFA